MPRWRDVFVLYRWEVRSALRERTIIINSILVPILLYPVLLWAAFTAVSFAQGQTEGLLSRVAVGSEPAGHADLIQAIRTADRVRVVEPAPVPTAAEALVRSGDLDAWIEFLPPAAAGLDGNFRVRLAYDESKERSDAARERVTAAIDDYRARWIEDHARAGGVTSLDWERFGVERRNVATSRQMGAFLLSLMLSLFFVIMVAVGCFYPAIDTTAGERERGTWETLMSAAVNRSSIFTAKYLYVATFGGLAGTLNMAAMLVTIKPVLAPLMEASGRSMEFTLPVAALPVLVLAAGLLAAFVAAGMMVFAAFARTFREGQSMIAPFYMLVMMAALFLQSPGLEFSYTLAATPVANLVMTVREAITGVFHWPQIALTVAVTIGAIGAAVWMATFVLRYEDVVVGSFAGGATRFIRERVLGRRPPAAAGEPRR